MLLISGNLKKLVNVVNNIIFPLFILLMEEMLLSYIESKKKYNSLCFNEEKNLTKYCFFNHDDYNNHTCNVLYNLYIDCIKFKKLKL